MFVSQKPRLLSDAEKENIFTILHNSNYNIDRAEQNGLKVFQIRCKPISFEAWDESERTIFEILMSKKAFHKKFRKIQKYIPARTIYEIVDFYYHWKLKLKNDFLVPQYPVVLACLRQALEEKRKRQTTNFQATDSMKQMSEYNPTWANNLPKLMRYLKTTKKKTKRPRVYDITICTEESISTAPAHLQNESNENHITSVIDLDQEEQRTNVNIELQQLELNQFLLSNLPVQPTSEPIASTAILNQQIYQQQTKLTSSEYNLESETSKHKLASPIITHEHTKQIVWEEELTDVEGAPQSTFPINPMKRKFEEQQSLWDEQFLFVETPPF